MIIEESEIKIVKLIVKGLERLDPIRIYLEDFDTGQGQIIIQCYDKVWSSYWGGMGKADIASFVCGCDNHYLAKNIAPNIKSDVIDCDAINSRIKKAGLALSDDLRQDSDEWNEAILSENYETMEEIFGCDDWYHDLPMMDKNEYTYLCRILTEVKKALKEKFDL